MEVGGLLYNTLVFSCTKQWVWEQVHCRKQEAEGNSVGTLIPANPLCVKTNMNYFIYLCSNHAGSNMRGRLIAEKSKSKQLDSALRSLCDKARDSPIIAHKQKRSPQCPNALQDAATTDTTGKKWRTHRNRSLHLWEHIKPNTFLSHDDNYRSSDIYLFAQWRLGNLSLSRFPPKYADCLWNLDLQRFLWLHFKTHYVHIQKTQYKLIIFARPQKVS